jgi:hypothetical protein
MFLFKIEEMYSSIVPSRFLYIRIRQEIIHYVQEGTNCLVFGVLFLSRMVSQSLFKKPIAALILSCKTCSKFGQMLETYWCCISAFSDIRQHFARISWRKNGNY